MESQQMMEILLKEIKAGQEQNRINQEQMKADRKADQEKAEADREAAQEELLAKLDADRRTDKDNFLAKMNADLEQVQEFMKMLQAYQAKTDAALPAMQVRKPAAKRLPPHLNPKPK
jgi:hypothetical protein